MNPFIQVLLENLPAIVALAQEAFVKANPGLPPPTSAEVLATFEFVFKSSLLRDEQWLATHPPTPPTPPAPPPPPTP